MARRTKKRKTSAPDAKPTPRPLEAPPLLHVPHWTLVAAAALLLVFAFSLYRAATQSITHDEAVTYSWYLRRPLLMNLGPDRFDVNNHLLNTCIGWGAIRLFGHSHFTVRLPALTGALLFLTATLFLVRRLFGRTLFALAVYLALILNPLLMDFYVAARGYSLQLGFLTLGFLLADILLSKDPGDTPGKREWLLWPAMGLTFALAVAANMSVAFLVVATSAWWFGLWVGRAWRCHGTRAIWRHGIPALVAYAVPAGAIAAVVLNGPLKANIHGKFYYGSKSLLETARNLLMHSAGIDPDRGITAAVDIALVMATAVFPILLLAILGGFVVAVWRYIRRGREGMANSARGLALHGGTLVSALAMAGIAHATAGVLYPADRTGLALIVLTTLTLAEGAAWVARTRWARTAAVTVFLVVAALYLTQLRASWFAMWRYDAGVYRMMRVVRERHDTTDRQLHVGISWQLEPAVNFYRMAWNLKRMEPVNRREYFLKDRYFAVAPWDFYMLAARQAHLVQDLRLKPLVSDPVSGATLAIRPAPGAPSAPK